MLIHSIETHAPATGLAPLALALSVPRSCVYRARQRARWPRSLKPRAPRPTPANALSPQERATVLELLDSPPYCDQSPQEVHAHLLDNGQYHCSARTMYRILKQNQQVQERRNQLRHPRHAEPRLRAAAPNQVWTWDITKLKSRQKGECFFLYVIIDLYSRLAVGWMVAQKESQDLARTLIEQSIDKHRIAPGSLVLHSDRGAPMISKAVAEMLVDLGVEKSHSRPRVSNDNAFSESQFKTLKYCPQFPGRFDSIDAARAFCREFFDWYNHEHHHSGLAMLTPAQVHAGKDQAVLQQRHEVKMDAFRRNPIRFRNKPPTIDRLPGCVCINPPDELSQGEKNVPIL
jgi:putative transposase